MKRLSRIVAGILFAVILCCGCKAAAAVPVSRGQSVTDAANASDIDELTVHFMDVGQGDAVLIQCGERAMLIDAGEDGKGTQVQSYLQKQGVTKLDYVIGTHPDSDHIGGLDVIITKFDCGTILMPDYEKSTSAFRDVLSAMEYKRYQKTVPGVGDTYQLGDAQFTVVAPAGTYGDNSNDWSIGIVLKHGEKKFLFTGDAEEDAEADMTAEGISLSCDVYKAGHHGSNTSSSAALLDAADPAYAVISCGEGNDYGHPRAETLNQFRMRGIKVFRTDEQGTIVAASDGENITWNCGPSGTWKAGEPVGSRAEKKAGSIQTEAEPDQETDAGADQETDLTSLTYVLNTKSKKFHLPDCDSLPTSNRMDTEENRETLMEEGYSPCKRCNP